MHFEHSEDQKIKKISTCAYVLIFLCGLFLHFEHYYAAFWEFSYGNFGPISLGKFMQLGSI